MSRHSADREEHAGGNLGPAPRFDRGFDPELVHPPRSSPFRHVSIALRGAITRQVRRLELTTEDEVLDYGCAEMQYRELLAPARVTGADLPGNPQAELEIRPDGTLGVADESFDVVVSTQVLEHVEDPAVYLSECSRVLRPGGRLLLSTHGIMLYHPDPADYWRWTWTGLQRIVADAGLVPGRRDDVMDLKPTGLQLYQDGVYHGMRGRLRKRLFALVMQQLIRFADRNGAGRPKHNALVFSLIAVKPEREDSGASR